MSPYLEVAFPTILAAFSAQNIATVLGGGGRSRVQREWWGTGGGGSRR
ncbi:hypothetical protein [Phormidium sp. CCY1219]|nr:hypothetical protein [Phormidium sp. CCY1219]MEB3830429.1 hypothetical protein [Phormidium sp. CCY1219]